MASSPPHSEGKQTPSPQISPVDRLPLTPPPERASTSTIGFCIAHYNEDLAWLRPYASNTTVYSKGPEKASSEAFSKTVSLPNIGRETHTYLRHITLNYDSLPDITFFLQGDIHSVNEGTPAHTDLSLTELVALASELKPGAVLPIGLLHTFSSWGAIPYKPDWVRRRGATLVRSKYTPGSFWTNVLFPGDESTSPRSSSLSSTGSMSETESDTSAADPLSSSSGNRLPPKEVRFVQGACFAVTREAIHRRPHAWWARMLQWFEDLGEMNPEEGHYMERFWWSVFDEGVVVPR